MKNSKLYRVLQEYGDTDLYEQILECYDFSEGDENEFDVSLNDFSLTDDERQLVKDTFVFDTIDRDELTKHYVQKYREWARIPRDQEINLEEDLDPKAVIRACEFGYDYNDMCDLIRANYNKYMDVDPIGWDSEERRKEQLVNAINSYKDYYRLYHDGQNPSVLDVDSLNHAAYNYYDVDDLRSILGGIYEG